MRLVVMLPCLLGLSLAATLDRKPQPCASPTLLTGELAYTTGGEVGWTTIPFEYDAEQQRIRLYKWLTFKNVTYDLLLLYKEGVAYGFDEEKSICSNNTLEDEFESFGIPPNATLLGSSVIGSASIPGAGLLVNTWIGQNSHGGQFMVTVTDEGCVPVSVLTRYDDSEWHVLSYINNVNYIKDPTTLNPPPFCTNPEDQSEEKPVAFFADIKNKIKNVF